MAHLRYLQGLSDTVCVGLEASLPFPVAARVNAQ